ncbi:MAG: hypothetical protein EZS28_003163 [Streblomastix strix]|uniref:Uncharacterized protein n=1 Tax=Streblomastix strix TaxID=222440 RepID=A0A5J4X2P4_9EUKA|nr:MAG: hypothetical protein EZS28_003163 [Streblomastix strix]
MLLYDFAQVHFFFCVFQVLGVSFADVVVFMGKVLLVMNGQSQFSNVAYVMQIQLLEFPVPVVYNSFIQFKSLLTLANINYYKYYYYLSPNFFSLYKQLLFPYFVTSLDLNHIGGCIGRSIIQTRNVPSTEHEQRNLPHPDMSMPGMLFSWPWRSTMNVDACISEGECNM